MDIVPETKSGYLDIFLFPLRGVLAPVFDAYRRSKLPDTTGQEIPSWAVSDMRNTPIPYIVEHRYDFGNGGMYGPPDMPVRAGIVNVPRTVHVQQIKEERRVETGQEFYNGPQKNMELFVYSPFSLETDLPCSTSMLKY